MSVRDVKARLGSARLVLAQRSVVGDARKAMSNLQAAAVVDLITRVKDALSPVECSDLATFAADICWHTGDLDRVLRELCSVSAAQHQSKRRRCQQDFRSVLHYFSAESWAKLLGTTGKEAKLTLILGVAASLGMRTPSEPTLKLMASLWMLVAETEESKSYLDTPQKLTILQFAKAEFDRMRRVLPEPLIWYDVLPQPLEFMSNHPEVFKGIFKGSLPVPPSSQLHEELLRMDMSYGCRGGGRRSLGQGVPHVGDGRVLQQNTDPTAMMMQMMMQMMNNNSRRAPAGSITLTGQPPRRLHTVLMDESQSSAGQFQLPMPLCDQRPGGGSDSDGSPGQPPQQAILMPPSQVPGCKIVVVSDRVQPGTTSTAELALQTAFGVAPGMPGRPSGFVEEAPTGAGSVEDMLDMLAGKTEDAKARAAERAAAAKKAKKENAAKEKAATADNVASSPKSRGCAASGKPTKAVAKVKVAATKAVGKDKVATTARELAEQSEVPKAPAKKVPAPKTAAKAKAGAKAKVAVATAAVVGAGVPGAAAVEEITAGDDVLMLGCSKCRGALTGCSQCRSNSYAGRRFQRVR